MSARSRVGLFRRTDPFRCHSGGGSVGMVVPLGMGHGRVRVRGSQHFQRQAPRLIANPDRHLKAGSARSSRSVTETVTKILAHLGREACYLKAPTKSRNRWVAETTVLFHPAAEGRLRVASHAAAKIQVIQRPKKSSEREREGEREREEEREGERERVLDETPRPYRSFPQCA